MIRRARVASRARRVAALLLALGLMVALPLGVASGKSPGSATRPAVPRMLVHVRVHPGFRVAQSGGRGIILSRAWNHAAQPSAHAVGVNAVFPAFKVDFIYDRNPARPGRLTLKGEYLFPFYTSFESGPFGGCAGCPGSGHFADAHYGSIAPFAHRFGHAPQDLGIPRQFMNHTFSQVARGPIIMTGKTRFVQAAIGPAIGRFAVYGVNVSGERLVKLSSGCTPAYLDSGVSASALDQFLLNHVRDLPTVPCRQSVPAGDSVAVSAPLEYSSTSAESATVSGHANGSRWLIAFQEPESTIGRNQPACLPDALAELSRTTVFFQQRVSGNFDVPYQTAPASSPGFTCAYLQLGSRLVDPAVKVPVPDGRVSASGNRVFLAGDTVAISAPSSASAGSPFTVTVAGNASISGEELYVFAPFSPCANDAQSEYGVDSDNLAYAVGPGGYAKQLTITPPSNAPPTTYICAYLQYGAPSGPVPTGPTLAGAEAQVSVSGGSPAKDAARRRLNALSAGHPVLALRR